MNGDDNETEPNTSFCTRCKTNLPFNYFKKKPNGNCQARCIECNQKALKSRLCEHGKNKSLCQECGGNGLCIHLKPKAYCKECGGVAFCHHGVRKYRCVDCEGSEICPHKIPKERCKECGGTQICEHNRIRSACVECEGGSICEHKKRRNRCINCEGSQICKHKKLKSLCFECGGSELCEHKRRRDRCVDCEGTGICEHKKIRMNCVECEGSQTCEHKKIKRRCVECKGSSICIHEKRRDSCKLCDFGGYLRHIVSMRCRAALLNDKDESSIEYLGCDIESFKLHMEQQFHPGMSWDNYGEWEIDHITPIKYNKPSLEQQIKRLHFTNTQPLWKTENMAKGNRIVYGVIYNHNFHSEFYDC